MAFKALAEQTDGDFSLMERTLPPAGRRPPPRGQAHTFGNIGDSPARLLVLHAPAMDAYFKRLHELWSGEEPPSPEQERDLMRQYGMSPA